MYRRFGGRIVELHHFYARVNQIIDDELMPPVGSRLNAAAEKGMRLEQ